MQGVKASGFKGAVTNSTDDTFVEIYSQTCRACSALAPRLNSLALLLPKLPVSPAGIQSKIVKMDIDDEEGLPEPVYGVCFRQHSFVSLKLRNHVVVCLQKATPRLYFFPGGRSSPAATPLEVPMLQRGEDAQQPGLPTVTDLLQFAAANGVQLSPPAELLAEAAVAERSVQRINWMFEMLQAYDLLICDKAMEELLEQWEAWPGDSAQATLDGIQAARRRAQMLCGFVLTEANHTDVMFVFAELCRITAQLQELFAAAPKAMDAALLCGGMTIYMNVIPFADEESNEYQKTLADMGVIYGEAIQRMEASTALSASSPLEAERLALSRALRFAMAVKSKEARTER